jgi:signal transduction histidine kinase
VLTTQGLGAAVAGLTQRCSVPVRVDIPPERCSPVTETAAYFVISEALANVSKHARACRAAVSVRHIQGRLRVEICDDGIGGVAVDGWATNGGEGGGLPGLADRVAALGGSFRVLSQPGRGTTVTAEVPCA